MLNIQSQTRAIEQLEDTVFHSQDERLDNWRKLVEYFMWACRFGSQDELMTAFQQLPADDRIRELYDYFLWGFRHFADAIPDEARCRHWLDKAKLCFEAFICGSLEYIDDNQYDRAELMREEYLNECINFTIQELKDSAAWAEYDARIAQQEIEDHIPTARYQAGQGSAEALDWLRQHDPDFSEADYTAKMFPDSGNIPDESRPATEPVITPSESEARGEVPGNGIITAKYKGGKVGFSIITEDGLKKIIKGQTYRLPGYIWANIEENEQTIEWEKIR